MDLTAEALERYEQHHELKRLFLEEWKSQQLQCRKCGIVLSFGRCIIDPDHASPRKTNSDHAS